MEDIQYELLSKNDLNLHHYNNTRQLELLKKEIGNIVVHKVIPPEGWFDERFIYIHMYSQINWEDLSKRFHNKDDYIHTTASYINRVLDELIDERGTKPNFNILTYYRVINDIYGIWKYYSTVFMEEETDEGIIDLIEGMTFL